MLDLTAGDMGVLNTRDPGTESDATARMLLAWRDGITCPTRAGEYSKRPDEPGSRDPRCARA